MNEDATDEGIPLDGDQLAGIVELFDALDRPELERAVSELLYRRGLDPDEQPIADAIEAAIEAYELVAVPGAVEPDPDGLPVVAGPTAFPAAPERAEDLPHILDVESRSVDREAVGAATRERYREAVDEAVDAGDADAAERLLDLGYEIESWASVDLTDERDRLTTLLD